MSDLDRTIPCVNNGNNDYKFCSHICNAISGGINSMVYLIFFSTKTFSFRLNVIMFVVATGGACRLAAVRHH